MNTRDGKFYDGKSAVSTGIRCVVTSDELIIYNAETEQLVEVWKREDLFLDENHNTAIVLGNKSNKAKIELSNLSLCQELGINQDQLVEKDVSLIFKWLGGFGVAATLFWFSIPFVTKFVASSVPYHVEQTIASKMPIESSFKLCKLNAEQTHALKLYTDFLYPKNDLEKEMPVSLVVANNPAVNAFTFPGGKIILLSGLIKEMKTPQELLGVMSHEIGHVVARDSMSFLVRGTLLASLFGVVTGDFNSTFAVSPQIVLSMAALTFDRDMEKKADAYAAQRLISNKVTTSGLKSFFSRKNNEDSNILLPEMLMTHPNYDSRINLIEEFYPKKDLPQDILDNWQVIKGICST